MSVTQQEGDRSGSMGERIVRASLAVGIAHICFKLLVLIQAIVVGRYLDDAHFDAIYAFAFEGIVWAMFFRLGEETIGPCFLPVFMEEKDLRGEKSAWHLANVVLSVQALLLFGVIGLIMCFPDQVIQLGTAWTRKQAPEQYELARQSLVWIAPCLLGLSLGSTTYMILNGYKRFFLAAFGEASWKICVLVALVVGIGWFHLGYRAVLLGLLVGGFAKLGTHLWGLRHELRFLRFTLDVKSPAFRALLILMLPMIVGTVFSIVRDYYNNVYVLSTIDTEGLMKANSFGRKLFLAISWMVPYTVGIAMFPFFCELVDKNDRERLGRAIGQSCRMLCAVFIPMALVLMVVSEPLAQALFQGGKFTARTANWAAISNACYILALPAYALEFIFMQGYFANRKMISVIVIGIIFSTVSVAISYVCINVLGLTDVAALVAIAAGYTVSRTGKTFVLALILKRHIPMLPARDTFWFLARCVAVGLVAAAVTYVVHLGYGHLVDAQYDRLAALLGFLGGSWEKVLQLGDVAIAGGCGALVFLGASRLIRLNEPLTMMRWTTDKILARIRR